MLIHNLKTIHMSASEKEREREVTKWKTVSESSSPIQSSLYMQKYQNIIISHRLCDSLFNSCVMLISDSYQRQLRDDDDCESIQAESWKKKRREKRN